MLDLVFFRLFVQMTLILTLNSFQNPSTINFIYLTTIFYILQNQSLDSENQSSLNWTQSFNSTAELNDSSVRFVSTAELPNTIETFCNTPHPTAKQFDALQENDKLQGFRDYLKVKFKNDSWQIENKNIYCLLCDHFREYLKRIILSTQFSLLLNCRPLHSNTPKC